MLPPESIRLISRCIVLESCSCHWTLSTGLALVSKLWKVRVCAGDEWIKRAIAFPLLVAEWRPSSNTLLLLLLPVFMDDLVLLLWQVSGISLSMEECSLVVAVEPVRFAIAFPLLVAEWRSSFCSWAGPEDTRIWAASLWAECWSVVSRIDFDRVVI